MPLNKDSHDPSSELVRNLYSRMVGMRIVDEYTRVLCQQGYIGCVPSCRGHEAAQVGSAVCIEVGTDFTLPYSRDLGVVLTIGMTPYEIFRAHIQSHRKQLQSAEAAFSTSDTQTEQQWKYQKHNMVAATAPIATQILHAAGIAFASKLRKANAVTIAYCGDDAISEPDFLEGITFAAHHTLPAIYICERVTSYSHMGTNLLESPLQSLSTSLDIDYHCIDGSDVVAVYNAMQIAMQHARSGSGPILLEMQVCHDSELDSSSQSGLRDPLLHCQHYLEEHGMWNEEWATQLRARITKEVEQAMQDALRDG